VPLEELELAHLGVAQEEEVVVEIDLVQTQAVQLEGQLAVEVKAEFVPEQTSEYFCPDSNCYQLLRALQLGK
jgi:hypothetical protein